MTKQLKGSAVVLLLSLPLAFAQPYEHSFVASYGKDTASCGPRSSPCSSFQNAISNTSSGGTLDALDNSGDFGSISIPPSMSITIDGHGLASLSNASGQNLVMCPSVNFVVVICVNPGPGHLVTLRNLSGEVFSNTGSRDADIAILSGNVVIENVTLDLPTGYGITASTTGTVTINNVRIHGAGGSAVHSAGAQVTIRNSTLTNNYIGVAGESGGLITVDNTLIAYNTIGVLSSGAPVRLSNNTITDNTTGLSTANGFGTIISFVNNRIYGNGTNGAPTQSVFQK